MRKEIVNWVKNSVQILEKQYSGNFELKLLIRAFITQYELKAIRILGGVASTPDPGIFHRLKSEAGSVVNYFRNTSIDFVGHMPQTLDILFWPFQKMHIDATEDLYSRLESEGISVGCFSHSIPTDQEMNNRKLSNQIRLKKRVARRRYYYRDSNCRTILTAAAEIPDFQNEQQSIRFIDVLLLAWQDYYWLFRETTEIFDRLVARYQPQSIFVGNCITMVGNMLAHLAKRAGIKVFCSMHGIMNDYLEFSEFDFFYLFGNRDKRSLVQLGIAPEKLVVAGSPKIDKNLGLTSVKSNRDKIRALVALSGPGHSVTLVHHVRIIEALGVAANRFKEVEFYIKLHRKDRPVYYEKLVKLNNIKLFAYGNPAVSANIYDWIREADMLITAASTTALEAMILGVPVLTVDLVRHLGSVSFIREGATLHATETSQLCSNIELVLERGPEYQKHLKIIAAYSKDVFTQPEMGTTSFMVSHLESALKRT